MSNPPDSFEVYNTAISAAAITTQIKGIPIAGSTMVISNEVIYGLVVILVLLLLEGGLWGGLKRSAAAVARRFPTRPVNGSGGRMREMEKV